MSGKTKMPQVSAWANDLRSVFGADEMNSAMRAQGYYARENGVEIGARRYPEDAGITADRMVIRVEKAKGVR